MQISGRMIVFTGNDLGMFLMGSSGFHFLFFCRGGNMSRGFRTVMPEGR